MASVKLEKFIEAMGFKNLTPDIDVSGIRINLSEINRPALQLTGYFEHFEATRLQIIGFVEYTYMQGLSVERKNAIYEQLLSCPIPCIVFCRELHPDEIFLAKAIEKQNTKFLISIFVPLSIYITKLAMNLAKSL